MTQRVAVLGTGKIGEALVSGLLRAGKRPDEVLVTARRPERAASLKATYGVEAVGNAVAATKADTLILMVKPQDMAALLEELTPHVPAGKLVITGAAGITTHFIASRLAEGVPVVRVMTNTPVLVDEAMSAISAGAPGHRGAPGPHRGDLLPGRQDDPGPGGPAGRGHGAVRLRPGVLLLPRRGDDRRRHPPRPAPRGRRTT